MRILFFLVVLATLMSCQDDNTVIVETQFGRMTIQLFDSTPQHRDNFKKLVKEGYFDDLLFHRVIRGFMIQGGDPTSKGAPKGQPLGSGGPGYTIPQEIGIPHFKGMLAAARQGDDVNPDKESSGSQFYIVHGQPVSEASLQSIAAQKKITYSQAQIEKYLNMGGTPMLDGDYTVFGEVIVGLEVLDKIASVACDERNRPLEDIKMKIY